MVGTMVVEGLEIKATEKTTINPQTKVECPKNSLIVVSAMENFIGSPTVVRTH